MVVLSVVVHLGVFLAILFVPESFSNRRQFSGTVYEVSLVEMPAAGTRKKTDSASQSSKARQAPAKKATESAKRIPTVKKAAKKKVIAQRTASRPSSKPKKPKVSPSQQIDSAIERLEAKYQSPDMNKHLLDALDRIKAEAGRSDGEGSPRGGTTIEGLQIRLYQIEVESWVKSKWAYPTAARDAGNLESVIFLKVKSDGTIQKSWFEKRSNDTVFDQSVQKAIERSDPLPPFPEGYRKSYDEIEIIFNLKDLENS